MRVAIICLVAMALLAAACSDRPGAAGPPGPTWAPVTQPAATQTPPASRARLQISSVLYQLQSIELQAVGETGHDLVVMDYAADGSDETAFSAQQIAALKDSSGGPKLVLAYLSIGEAEDYRYYWHQAWDENGDGLPDPGAPAWLDVVNPDWAGNYKVRYWDPAWQAVIFGGPESYVDKIIVAGFDGVYLDIVDAYEYYERQGRDPAAREMVDFVMALAEYARRRSPGFLVFPQNAAELASNFPAYLATVDGIGQEDIYYGYPADGERSPLDFVTALESNLDLFVQAGKPVLVIAYTTDPDQIADHNARARARGYVPLATVRALDRLTLPAGQAADSARAGVSSRLADVTHWLYLIDVNLAPETVAQIVASNHDLVVLDFIPSEANNADYPMAAVVAQLHAAPRPKLVLAYLDIGQAEDFRAYWRPDWRIGDPEWIVGSDPDGWTGNYPVAFWYDEWWTIWLGAAGILQAVLEAGFDGIYLDWVEAYSDENVVAFAAQEGTDPRQEMIWWVGDLAAYGRAQNPQFIVVGQNAAELAAFDEYLEIVDAIAQEQVWFDGAADNDPPGDCPLPRTEADVESEAYVASLSAKCRAMYDEFPDSTLHVSSESYLQHLSLARSKGTLVLTVDYAQDPDNIAWVHTTSRSLGFVPFVGDRALNRYVAPWP